ncbi:MAG: cysteine desulfurase [Treponema sp.]|nr:cysteine desulfurase [Treponema sp.]
MKRYYFDWAATAIPAKNIANCADNTAFVPVGNPSSIHTEGNAARQALENARRICAKSLEVKPEEIYFTSGGTESNTIVLFSLLTKPRRFVDSSPQEKTNKSAVFLYSAAEHPSIRENITSLEHLGIPCASIGVEKDGRVSEATLEKTLKKNSNTRMAALMTVNNETGAINDIKALSALIRKKQNSAIHIHCDAVQALGKIKLDLYNWGIDSASFSAHKIGGCRGIGLLWLKSPITPLVRGGDQEKKIRPGTENTQGAINLAESLEKQIKAETSEYKEASEKMKTLISKLHKTGSFIPIPSGREAGDNRFSPWILQCAFKNKNGTIIPGEVMVRTLDEKGFAVSTGSACSSADKRRPVLEAMDIDREVSLGGIRISQGYSTTMEEINLLADTITALLITL